MKCPIPDTVEWFDRLHLRDDKKDGDEDVQSGLPSPSMTQLRSSARDHGAPGVAVRNCPLRGSHHRILESKGTQEVTGPKPPTTTHTLFRNPAKCFLTPQNKSLHKALASRKFFLPLN